MKNPPTPAISSSTEIIEPAGRPLRRGRSQNAPSLAPALSSLLDGRTNLSGDMAFHVEKAFGVGMDTLIRMQSSYNIAQTRKREKEIRVRRFRLLPRPNHVE